MRGVHVLRPVQLALPIGTDQEQIRCGLCGKRYKTLAGCVTHLLNVHDVIHLEGVPRGKVEG